MKRSKKASYTFIKKKRYIVIKVRTKEASGDIYVKPIKKKLPCARKTNCL